MTIRNINALDYGSRQDDATILAAMAALDHQPTYLWLTAGTSTEWWIRQTLMLPVHITLAWPEEVRVSLAPDVEIWHASLLTE